jgi:hypothetical protein
MASLGDLVVNLGLNAKKFTSGIGAAQSSLSKFGAMAKSMITPVTAGFAALAAGAATAGVAIYAFTQRIAGLAQISDDAIKLGVSGKFLQQLGYAADQSGVSVDTLTGGMKKLTIAIGKGDDKPFAALKLNLAELKGLNPEQQFLNVASAISKLPTAADRAAAAVKVFGKTGIEMTGLFAGGMDDLNALMADAEKLGIGISAEGLAKAAAADDAIQRMKASFGALLDQITVGVAPAFGMVATALADLIPPVTKFFDKFNAMDGKVQFLADLIDSGLEVAFLSVLEKWDDMLAGMVNKTTIAAAKMAWDLSPAGMAANATKWAAGKVGIGGGAEQKPRNERLDAAKLRMNEVLSRLGPDDQGLIRGKLPAMGGKPKAVGGGGGDIAGLASSLAESATGLFGRASLAAQSKFTDLKIKGGYLGSIVENMFTGKPAEKSKAGNQETRFAGAMQKGSAEAYSTIVQAMFRGKDPNVQATEKQTMQLVKAIKETKPKQAKFLPEFA